MKQSIYRFKDGGRREYAEFYAKDYPDGLTDPTVDITFLNQKKGYDYRLRGVFAAVHNGLFEGFSPVTAGIRIE